MKEPEILPQEPKVRYQIVNGKKVEFEEFEGSDLQIFLTTNKRTKNIFNKLTKLYFLSVDLFSGMSRSDRKVIFGQYSPEVTEDELVKEMSYRVLTLLRFALFALAFIILGVIYHDLFFIIFGFAFIILGAIGTFKKK